MYNFKLQKDEQINLISNESILKIDNEEEIVTTIITNKRLLIFNYPKDIESFRIGRIIDTYKQNVMDLIFETPLTNIKEIIQEKNFDKYLLNDTNYFYLQDEQIKEHIKNKQ